MRLGEHAVFRLDGVQVVVRIGRSTEYAEHAARELGVSAWLNGAGVAVVVPATSAVQPVVVDGRVVTFWEAAGDGDTYGTVEDLVSRELSYFTLGMSGGRMAHVENGVGDPGS
jgi:hypothetical protein